MAKIDNIPQTTAVAQDQQMIAGIQKTWSKVKSLQIAGNAQTPAELEAIFQADIDATTDLQAAVATVKVKRATRVAARLAAAQARQEIKQYVLGVYGKTAETTLQDFGLAAPKPAGTTEVMVKAKAVLQMRATRKLRGTLGPKAKAAIKAPPVTEADVQAAVSAPAPAPATPVVAPASK